MRSDTRIKGPRIGEEVSAEKDGVVIIEQVSNRIWTIPNAISGLRLLLVPVFAVLVFTGYDVWALIVVTFSSISDWADGFIARRLNQVTKLGQALDPIADRCFIFVTILALTVRGVLPWWLLILVALRDVVMLILVSVIAKRGHQPMAVTIVGKAATLCLLVAFPLFIFSGIPEVTGMVEMVSKNTAWVFAVLGVILYWASAGQYLVRGRALLTTGDSQ